MIYKLKTILIQRKLWMNSVLTARFKRSEIQKNTNFIIDQYVRQMRLKICRNLYSSPEAASKWYLKSGPKAGLEVNVDVVDTKPVTNQDDQPIKTLVALHGCPGNYLDFSRLIRHFGPNYRVIIPNFPDFSVTDKTNSFWHSAQEKADYIRDMLKELDVRQIDCLIVHSSAIFPASYLWLKDNPLNSDFQIKSLCLLSNPGPKWYTSKARLMSTLFVNISRLQSVRQYLRQIWSKKLTNRLGIRNQIKEYDSLALLLSTFLLSQTPTVDKRLDQLTQLQIPTLCVFSLMDRLFTPEVFYDLFRCLKTNDDNFDVYEEHQNILVQKANDSHWLKVVDIRSGGHYVFATHSALVHKYIEELLQKVK